MKKVIFISILVLSMSILALVIFYPKATNNDIPLPSLPPAPTTESQLENTKEIPITATTKNYGEASEKYKYQIEFSYPFFEGSIDKKVLDTINSQIERKVQTEVDKYIAEARKNKIAPIFGYLTGKYKYSINSDKSLSIEITMERYLSGASSPQNIQITWYYDLNNGQEVSLPNR